MGTEDAGTALRVEVLMDGHPHIPANLALERVGEAGAAGPLGAEIPTLLSRVSNRAITSPSKSFKGSSPDKAALDAMVFLIKLKGWNRVDLGMGQSVPLSW